jgi:hypothetical protein
MLCHSSSLGVPHGKRAEPYVLGQTCHILYVFINDVFDILRMAKNRLARDRCIQTKHSVDPITIPIESNRSIAASSC